MSNKISNIKNYTYKLFSKKILENKIIATIVFNFSNQIETFNTKINNTLNNDI